MRFHSTRPHRRYALVMRYSGWLLALAAATILHAVLYQRAKRRLGYR